MRKGKYPFIAAMLLPPVALYAVFVLSPYVQAFQISFTDWTGLTAKKNYVGFANYDYLYHDSTFWTSVKHNLIALPVIIVFTIGLGLFFAAMLNSGGRKGKAAVQGVRGSSFYKIVYFFPYILSVVVVGVLWEFVYDSTDSGLLNGFLKLFGVHPIDWTGSTSIAFWAILAVVIWSSVGFYVVLFSAAMASIPAELYEAAILDGASRWKTFSSLTIPLMWDTLQVGVIYLGIQALDLYAIVSTMSAGGNGGPDNSTQVISTWLYQTGFKFGTFGRASAMGVALLILTLGLTAIAFGLSRRERLEF